MVVRLDFKTQVILIIEGHNPGIVHKHADAPVTTSQSSADGASRGKDGFLEHVAKLPAPSFILVLDPPRKCFVAAMLAPCLGDRLQFDVCWIAIKRRKVRLYRAHFS